MNLRGTLEVIQLARRAQNRTACCAIQPCVAPWPWPGKRSNEVVTEDDSIDWTRSDYDPYARTKKFCEHMVRELLPDVPRTVFVPSIVLGDSRRAETTQFDMVRAFVFLAGLPVLPLRPDDRIDIVPVDYVAERDRDAAPESRSRARDLSPVLGHRLAKRSPDHDGAGGGWRWHEAAYVSSLGTAVFGDRGLACRGGTARSDAARRC